MLYWPEEFLLKDKLLSLWGSDCMIFISLHLLLLMIFFCMFKLSVFDKNILVGCYTSGSSCLEHSAVLVFRELFPSPFNGGFQVLSLEEFSQAPTPPPILFFFFHVIFFFLLFFSMWISSQ